MVRAIYCRSRSLGGALIRAASWWDQWSHCGLLTGDNTVINARAFHGVVEEPLNEFAQRYSWTEIVPLNLPDPVAAVRWARKHIGDGYDYGAVINIISNKFGAREAPERWQCAEFLEATRLAGGIDIWRCPLWSLSPSMSHKVKS
jgi:uncharacterized protein YycO